MVVVVFVVVVVDRFFPFYFTTAAAAVRLRHQRRPAGRDSAAQRRAEAGSTTDRLRSGARSLVVVLVVPLFSFLFLSTISVYVRQVSFFLYGRSSSSTIFAFTSDGPRREVALASDKLKWEGRGVDCKRKRG